MPTKRIKVMKKTENQNKPLKEITAAGGVLFRHGSGKAEVEVLLIFRRGVWDLPKGKQEQDETIEECAVREVAEEIGVSGLPKITAPLIKTYHDYEENDTLLGKTTHWYAMQLTSEKETFTPEEKEGIKKVKWHSLNQAKKKVAYSNLLDVLDVFARIAHR